MWLTAQSKIQPDCLSVRLMKYRQKCLRTDKQVYWLWDWHNIIPDSLKETLHFLLSCVGWFVYNICYSCQCFLYPCGQLPSLLPSTTDVRIIRSSRKRIYRESLAEVRLGFCSVCYGGWSLNFGWSVCAFRLVKNVYKVLNPHEV